MCAAYPDLMRICLAIALACTACTDDVAVFTDRDTFPGDSLASEIDSAAADTLEVFEAEVEAEVDTFEADVPLADLDVLEVRDAELTDLDVGPDTEEGTLVD